MPQDLLHKIFYAFLSGVTELLPVSAAPHQMIYQVMTGFIPNDVYLTLSIHLGVLIALLISCKDRIKRLSNERRLSRLSRRRRNRQPDTIALLDIRVLQAVAIPVLLSLLLCKRAEGWISGVLLMTLMLILNGVVLFIPRLLRQGDKDGRAISRLDSLLIGLGGAIGAIPGLSRVGGMLSAGLSCGVDRQYILDTTLLISIPATIGLILFDIFAAATSKAAITGMTLLCLVTGGLSFGGAMLGITLMRYLSVKTGFKVFGYYSFGLGLISFILYLVI